MDDVQRADSTPTEAGKACRGNESMRRRRVSVKSSRIHRHSTAGLPGLTRPRTLSKPVPLHLDSPSLCNEGKNISPALSATDQSGIKSVVSPCRRISLAVSKRPTSTMIEHSLARRRSEPHLSNILTPLPNRRGGKVVSSLARKPHGGRKFSTAEALTIRNNRKLEVLAQDELLTCLNLSNSVHNEDVKRQHSAPCASTSIVSSTKSPQQERVKRLQEAKKRAEKRACIVKELLETEQHYITCLGILNDVFKTPLEGRHIVQGKDLDAIFPSSLDEILQSHLNFMQDLKRRVDEKTDDVGECVSKMTCVSTNLLDMYTRYVTSFPKSISTLTKYIRGSNKFRKFLESCYRIPIVERLDLPSFLLSPVQRLPRYILLLSELYKYTDAGHPEKQVIQVAKNEMEQIIISLDSSIKVSMESYSNNSNNSNNNHINNNERETHRKGFKLSFATKRKKSTKGSPTKNPLRKISQMQVENVPSKITTICAAVDVLITKKQSVSSDVQTTTHSEENDETKDLPNAPNGQVVDPVIVNETTHYIEQNVTNHTSTITSNQGEDENQNITTNETASVIEKSFETLTRTSNEIASDDALKTEILLGHAKTTKTTIANHEKNSQVVETEQDSESYDSFADSTYPVITRQRSSTVDSTNEKIKKRSVIKKMSKSMSFDEEPMVSQLKVTKRRSGVGNTDPLILTNLEASPSTRRSRTFDNSEIAHTQPGTEERTDNVEMKRGRDNKWRKSFGLKLSHWFQHDRSNDDGKSPSLEAGLAQHMASGYM